MITTGLMNCFRHPDNGMTREDMMACVEVSDEFDEVIIFRSTGSWSLRWIGLGYPTKNFHVKGKSSDWGPQAGFVPYDGRYSKVGAHATLAAEGTAANDDGIKHHYAATTQLSLSKEELALQRDVPAGNPPHLALSAVVPIDGSPDVLMRAERMDTHGRPETFVFRGVWTPAADRYLVWVYTAKSRRHFAAIVYESNAARGKLPDAHWGTELEKLLVMTSSERGADNKPMTGDYDLMAVCPRWTQFGRTSDADITKDRLDFGPGLANKGITIGAGRNLDAVLEPRLSTGVPGKLLPNPNNPNRPLKATFQGLRAKDAGKLDEHGDLGNVSGRILRCIVALNGRMPNGATALRRVHHNAESHRNHIFGALDAAGMGGGDGFPLTAFHPSSAYQGRHIGPLARYAAVCTLETMAEFRTYAQALHDSGFMLPKHWAWGMSIRNRVAAGEFNALNAALAAGQAQRRPPV